ncbi:MAG: Holliday junction branch migration protein RuvA [Myxococcota bacterium]
MIARLEGVLIERHPTRVVIDVGGVGYEALVPLSTFSRLPDEGKTVALRIHTHVREDALQLFGFATELERAAFGLLLHASRVGPKLAQAILSGVEADALVEAIRNGDVAALRAAPGVGAKLAERIVVELRDRVTELVGQGDGGATPRAPASPTGDARKGELVSALVNLQTPRPRAERVAGEVVGDAAAEAPIEELVRSALQRLAK